MTRDPGAEGVGGFPEELGTGYVPLRLLGGGAQASVYLAVQRSLDRRVVVKVLRSGSLATPASEQRFRREARVLRDLRHRNVIRLLDYGTRSPVAWMVYPDEQGRSLAELLEEERQGTRRRMSVAEVVDLLEQVLAGLEAVHGAGVVHRDLKPGNLLVTPEGDLRILDLGLALCEGDVTALTADGILVGTPLYMAPDPINGEPAEPRDDLYAVGLIAYRLLSGSHPFMSREIPEVLQAHFLKTPPHLSTVVPGLPHGLGDWVQSMIAKTRTGRPAGATEARDGLRSAMGRDPGVPDRFAEDPTLTLDEDQGLEPSDRPGAGAPPVLAMELEVDTPQGRSPRLGSRRGAMLATSTLITVLGLAMASRSWIGVGQDGTGAPGPTPPVPGAGPPTLAPSLLSPWPRLGDRARSQLGTWLEASAGKADTDRDADPTRFGVGAGAIAAVTEVAAWLDAGGDPDRLSQEALQELAEVDAVYRQVDLPAPFLALEPGRSATDPLELTESERTELDPLLAAWVEAPRMLGGLAGRYLQELRRVRDLMTEVAADPSARVAAQLVRYGSDRDRIAVAATYSQAHARFRTALALAAESLRREPSQRMGVLFLLSVQNATYGLGMARIGASLLLPFSLQMPGLPDCLEGRMAELIVLCRIEETRTLLGLPRGELAGRIRDRLLRVIGDPRNDPDARRIRETAVFLSVRFLHREERPSDLVPWLEDILSVSRESCVRDDRRHLLSVYLGSSLHMGARSDPRRREAVLPFREPVALLLEAEFPELAATVRARWPDLPQIQPGVGG